MKTAVKTRSKPAASFEQSYRAALLEYAERRGEAALGRAYELGRRGIAEGKSLLDIAAVHHLALAEIMADRNGRRPAELLNAGAEFLAESLSPYEMAHRGFHDAVTSLRRLNETLEEEIKRIAHAVHDDAGQLLVAVHLALSEFSPELVEPQKRRVLQIQELLRQVEDQLRRYSHELRPSMLDDLGWLPALRFLAESVSKRSGIRIHVESNVRDRLHSSLETTLYRTVQEALNNAAKHSKASQVRIKVDYEGRTLCCSIVDDGVGFNPRALRANPGTGGLGLLGMKERLNAVGGTLNIKSSPGQGAKLFIRFPWEKENADTNRSR